MSGEGPVGRAIAQRRGAGDNRRVPMTLSDDQLRALAAAPEAYDLEKKRSFSKRDGEKIRRTLCAFANDLPGSGRTGVLLLGVSDDGEIVGTPATDEDLRTLIQFARDGSMQPIPTVLGEMRTIDGHPLLVMQVDPCPAAPVRWDGRIWVRTGVADGGGLAE